MNNTWTNSGGGKETKLSVAMCNVGTLMGKYVEITEALDIRLILHVCSRLDGKVTSIWTWRIEINLFLSGFVR